MSEEKLAELEQDNNTHGYLYYSGAAKLVAEVRRLRAEKSIPEWMTAEWLEFIDARAAEEFPSVLETYWQQKIHALIDEVRRCWEEIAKLKEQKTSKVQCDDLEHKPM